MKKKLPFLIFVLLFGSLLTLKAQEESVSIHVKLKDTFAVRSLRLHTAFGALERIFPHAPKFEERHRKHGLHLWYQLKAINEQQGHILLDSLKLLPEVDKAEIVLPCPKEEYEVEQISVARSTTSAQAPVNDPLYPKQWHYQSRAYPYGIDINLEKAWEMEQGSRDVVVAVMDDGIEVQHEDLAANMWTNEAELNGLPGVDDDQNGYVDDIYGYNFKNEDGKLRAGEHGTHVAGTVAAVNNNGVGVCGVAGGNGVTTGVRLICCQILNDRKLENLSLTDLAKAYVYAADMGAVISQNSWAYETMLDTEILSDAVNYFMKEAGQYEGSPMKGGLVVWAAGNNNSSVPAKPQTHPKINKEQLVIVGAMAYNGSKASYSNYGDWVNVSAPGGDIGMQQVLSTIVGNRYGYMYGTSMACPHVSGVAALVVSKFKGEAITPQAVRHRLLTSVNGVNRYSEGHLWENLMGTGRIDTWKALLSNNNKAPNKVSEINVVRHTPGMVMLSWLMAEDEDDRSIHTCRIYWSTNPFTASNLPSTFATLYTAELNAGEKMVYQTDSLLPNKQYYFAVEGIDRWGNRSPLSDVVSSITNENVPVIYSPYRYNTFYLRGKDTVTLNFSVVAPEGMETELTLFDRNSLVKMNQVGKMIELQVATQKGMDDIYNVALDVYDKSNKKNITNLKLTFIAFPFYEGNVPGPAFKPDISTSIHSTTTKGKMQIDLHEYLYDPSGLDFYWQYDPSNDTELDEISHMMKGRIDGNILYIEYEFSTDSWVQFVPYFIVPITVYNSHIKGGDLFLKIFYTGTMGMDEAEIEATAVYPTVAKQQVTIQSPQPIEKIRFYNMAGVLCLEQNTPSTAVNVGTLAPGHYMVQLITSKGIVVRRIEK